MLFGVVSGVGQGIGVLGWRSSKGRGSFGGKRLKVGHPIVTNGDFVA